MFCRNIMDKMKFSHTILLINVNTFFWFESLVWCEVYTDLTVFQKKMWNHFHHGLNCDVSNLTWITAVSPVIWGCSRGSNNVLNTFIILHFTFSRPNTKTVEQHSQSDPAATDITETRAVLRLSRRNSIMSFPSTKYFKKLISKSRPYNYVQ